MLLYYSILINTSPPPLSPGVALTATLIINIFVVAIFASEFSGDEFIRPSIGKAVSRVT